MPSLPPIPNHGHCAICGKATPFAPITSKNPEERTCSKACAEGFVERQRKLRKSQLTMYALMALAFLVLILSIVNPQVFGGA